MLTVEKIFDMTANNYEKTEEVKFKEYTEITIANTKRYLKPTDEILDYGCATGTKTLSLAGCVNKITAIDISSKMIELAKQKITDHENEKIKFLHTSIFDERFTHNYFDVVMVFNILHLVENDYQVIERITDILKPGGLLISTTPCLAEKMTLENRIKFFPVRLLMSIKLFPSLKKYRFTEVENLLQSNRLKIVEAKKYFERLSSYFLVASKIEDKK